MDDGDLDFTNPDTYLCPSLGADTPGGCSLDSYFDDILNDTEHLACTHAHICNPPARDLSHTHTCVHVHTKVVAASSDGGAESPSASKKRRPSSNRTAVRKYREKKKAHTALLEEEVVHLKALNKQLMRKVQSHAALETEVARLRCLLVNIRGRIEVEIGAFPYGRPAAKSAVDLVHGGGVDLATGHELLRFGEFSVHGEREIWIQNVCRIWGYGYDAFVLFSKFSTRLKVFLMDSERI